MSLKSHRSVNFFLFHTDEDGGATSVTHDKGGYLDLGPLDLGENARRDMVLTLEEMGIDVESSFHEVAAGQHELDFCPAAALRTADQLMTAKFAIRTIAKTSWPSRNLYAKNQKPEFTDRVFIFPSPCFRREKDVVCQTNPMNTGSARGILLYGRTDETHQRNRSDYQSACKLLQTSDTGIRCTDLRGMVCKNRSPLIRIPLTGDGIMAIELRCPDSAANPYLALAVCMAAGLDGIKQKIVPPSPVDRNISDLTEEERNAMQITLLPGSLGEAVAELKKDDFLCQVLGQEFVNGYINAKEEEWHEYLRQVSDWETEKYLYRI